MLDAEVDLTCISLYVGGHIFSQQCITTKHPLGGHLKRCVSTHLVLGVPSFSYVMYFMHGIAIKCAS